MTEIRSWTICDSVHLKDVPTGERAMWALGPYSRGTRVHETVPVVDILTELLEAATDSISYVEEQMEGQHASSIHDAAEVTANRLAVACMEARTLLAELEGARDDD